MSGHDRGAFGELLDKAKAQGWLEIHFACILDRGPEEARWTASAHDSGGLRATATGRTGEEALRLLVGGAHGS